MMHCDYLDIVSRIAETPIWYDEHAVPRYCEFRPEAVANIYADQVALAMITCQSCRRAFRVAFSWCRFSGAAAGTPVPSLAEQIRAGTLHYGDPPNALCCPAGPTMNSEPQSVLEFWQKDENFHWRLVPELHVALVAPWDAPTAPAGDVEHG